MKSHYLNNILIVLNLLCFSSSALVARSFSTKATRINKVSRLISSGQSKKASIQILSLLKKKQYNRYRGRLYFLLGLSFEKLNLKNSSVWALLESIKSAKGRGGYAKKSFTRLLLTASSLGDDLSIKKALSFMALRSFSFQGKSKLYFVLGKSYFNKGKFTKATVYFSKISKSSSIYLLSHYFLANSLVELGRFTHALKAFKKISRKSKLYTKMNVAAILGQARIYYQLKNWKKALNFYSKVPRDSEFWVQALQESAWVELRLNKLNMALRHFQTLHSSYYKEYYIPESLILRAVVYLKLCRYEEVKKILKIYNQEYSLALNDVSYLLKRKKSIYSFYVRLLRQGKLKSWKATLASSDKAKVNLKQTVSFVQERKQLARLYRGSSRTVNPVSGHLKLRLSSLKRGLKVLGKSLLSKMQRQLIGLKKQKDFIYYELLKSRQTAIKRKIIEKKLGIQVEDREERKREFYIQNGYEYWPFQGEYWLDELGNYYYIGGSSCEK